MHFNYTAAVFREPKSTTCHFQRNLAIGVRGKRNGGERGEGKEKRKEGGKVGGKKRKEGKKGKKQGDRKKRKEKNTMLYRILNLDHNGCPRCSIGPLSTDYL